jgi:hypothetical protein
MGGIRLPRGDGCARLLVEVVREREGGDERKWKRRGDESGKGERGLERR